MIGNRWFGGSGSLLRRMGALALAVTLVSLLLHIAVMYAWLQPFVERMASQLASHVHLTRNLIEATPRPQRGALNDMSLGKDFQLVRSEKPSAASVDPPEPIGALVMQHLGSGYQVGEIPGEADLAHAFSPRLLFVSFLVDGEPWHIVIRTQPPVWAVLGTGVGWLLLATVAVAASFLLGSRLIVEPIRQIAERIADQDKTIKTLQTPARASPEVTSLVDSFNRLVQRMQAADRTKQQLLAGVSHDLRTPLARLRLRIETQCDSEVSDAADVELSAVEHIISQFLAYVHGQTAGGTIARTSLIATATDVVASYAEQGKPVRLSVEASDTQLAELDVKRVLINLIDNALIHGAPPVEVCWRSGNGHYELAVWDHGTGLSEQQFSSAMQPFVRLTNDVGLGHCGLGLAIVAQIAQQWGAQLESRRGPGGRFGVVVAWPTTAAMVQP